MTIFSIPFIVVIGWAVGAGVNYLADVLPWKRALTRPFCLKCQAQFPQKNYWFWPRRCPACGARRPWRTLAVEVFFSLAAIWLWQYPSPPLGFWLSLLLLAYFGVVVVIDIEYHLILHPVSLVGTVLGLALGVWWRTQQFDPSMSSLAAWWFGLWTSLAGGALGFGIMFFFYGLGGLFMRLMNRLRAETVEEDALGFGDVNLSGVLGLLLGWHLIPVGLFLSVLLAGGFSLLYLIIKLFTRRYHAFMALPYGPFLVAGAAWLVYFPQGLLNLLR